MAQATKSIVINVTPEQLFDIINDFAKYPEFLPEVKKTAVADAGGAKDVTYTIEIMGKAVSYTLKHAGEKPNKATWTFVKGEMMKNNVGSWALKAVPGGTEATYTIDLKLGTFVPGFVEKALAETSLPALLDNFKKRAEKLHPKA
ncbi:MAG: SRPBCC family protein [Deltaproteobacteria bacterium]|nr:SRPBCC family protein [Deltaproteobacteria bacterium]